MRPQATTTTGSSHGMTSNNGLDDFNFGPFAGPTLTPSTSASVNKNPTSGSALPNLIGNTLVSDLWN